MKDVWTYITETIRYTRDDGGTIAGEYECRHCHTWNPHDRVRWVNGYPICPHHILGPEDRRQVPRIAT